METVNVHDAKTRLSKLLEQVQAGEEVIIARAGHPVARLVAFEPSRKAVAPPGGMAGEIHLADDFDAPLDELFEVLEFGSSAEEP
jgi:prevent-host-death family protein